MRTRLRIEQEKPIVHRSPRFRREPEVEPPEYIDRGTAGEIAQLQQSHGNAFVRRFLQTQADSLADSQTKVRRDPDPKSPDSKPSDQPDRPKVFATIKLDGKAVPGPSQQPGHKGQFEVVSAMIRFASRIGSAQKDKSVQKMETQEVELVLADDPAMQPFFNAFLKNSAVDVHLEFGTWDKNGKFVVGQAIDRKQDMIGGIEVYRGGGRDATQALVRLNLVPAKKEPEKSKE